MPPSSPTVRARRGQHGTYAPLFPGFPDQLPSFDDRALRVAFGWSRLADVEEPTEAQVRAAFDFTGLGWWPASSLPQDVPATLSARARQSTLQGDPRVEWTDVRLVSGAERDDLLRLWMVDAFAAPASLRDDVVDDLRALAVVLGVEHVDRADRPVPGDPHPARPHRVGHGPAGAPGSRPGSRRPAAAVRRADRVGRLPHGEGDVPPLHACSASRRRGVPGGLPAADRRVPPSRPVAGPDPRPARRGARRARHERGPRPPARLDARPDVGAVPVRAGAGRRTTSPPSSSSARRRPGRSSGLCAGWSRWLQGVDDAGAGADPHGSARWPHGFRCASCWAPAHSSSTTARPTPRVAFTKRGGALIIDREVGHLAVEEALRAPRPRRPGRGDRRAARRQGFLGRRAGVRRAGPGPDPRARRAAVDRRGPPPGGARVRAARG